MTNQTTAPAVSLDETEAQLEEGFAPLPADLVPLREQGLALREQIDALQEQYDKIKETMGERAEALGVRAFTFHGKTRFRVTIGTRTSVDGKRLKEEKPDVYKEYLKTTHYKSSKLT